MAVNFVPLHDRILVRRVEEQETTPGGLIIPDTAKDKPQEGEVLAVGKGKIKDDGLEGEEQIGVDIVKRAMEEPLRQIVANAGEEGAIVLGKVRESDNPNFGYNAQTDEFEDLVNAGVIDPTKVVRTALQNAGSIASLMLTTEALISEIPEEKKPMAAPPGADGMY